MVGNSEDSMARCWDIGTVVVVKERNVAKIYLEELEPMIAEREHSGNTEATAVKRTNRSVKIGRRNPICSFLKELRIKCPYNRATNGGKQRRAYVGLAYVYVGGL